MSNRVHDWLACLPNGFDANAPVDYFTSGEAGQAIRDAKRIHDFR
jgi:hypothetical protein